MRDDADCDVEGYEVEGSLSDVVLEAQPGSFTYRPFIVIVGFICLFD